MDQEIVDFTMDLNLILQPIDTSHKELQQFGNQQNIVDDCNNACNVLLSNCTAEFGCNQEQKLT
jgi:hypothetical protein